MPVWRWSWISYDLARLSESGEYTDGGVGPYSNYYSSLLVPPTSCTMSWTSIIHTITLAVTGHTCA